MVRACAGIRAGSERDQAPRAERDTKIQGWDASSLSSLVGHYGETMASLSWNLSAAVALGTAQGSFIHRDGGRSWQASHADLTSGGRKVFNGMCQIFGAEPILLTYSVS